MFDPPNFTGELPVQVCPTGRVWLTDPDAAPPPLTLWQRLKRTLWRIWPFRPKTLRASLQDVVSGPEGAKIMGPESRKISERPCYKQVCMEIQRRQRNTLLACHAMLFATSLCLVVVTFLPFFR